MPYPQTFRGFASQSHENWTDFDILDFKPKTWTEDDIDIEILYCGVCGSDVHMISGGWKIPDYPLVVGHEVVGTVKRIGSNVTGIKLGDVVGIGAQIGSCHKCTACVSGHENYCLDEFIDTYDCHWPDGTRTQGGYSNFIRADSAFVFKIPEGVAPEEAAPMLCGGLTVYAPLVHNGCGAGKTVGIVGLGGLGHYAVQFAAALGADVWVLSHSPKKRDDALKLGAKHFVTTNEPGWEKPLRQHFDLIVSTTDCDHDFPLRQYMSTLRPLGKFECVGMPNNALPEIHATHFLPNGCSLGATHIGSPREARQMLEFAAKHGVRSWIQKVDMTAQGCKEVVTAVYNGSARYRWVLVNKNSFAENGNAASRLVNGHKP